MDTPADLGKAHLRVARPTDDLAAVARFYRDGLGFEVLSEFRDHDGFDGVMLGPEGAAYHLEFTRRRGHPAGRAPTVRRLEALGYSPVPSFNPYWDVRGRTFEGPDGYRVVLQNAAWPGRSRDAERGEG